MKVKLTDAEWKVMETLWREEPKTIMQITKELQEETGWTKYTVMSFLKRMEDKGAVHFNEGERAKLYYSDLKREDASLQEAEEFLGKVFEGRLGLMVNAMVKKQALSEEEIKELYDILATAKETGKKE
ncbi:MAG: BlaI/MecI/CopY family transcriptional regulator [Lachnospiraceae bacterium]|nr:BlaI/MecI/CopY family transcriptional regulator [Lachnospiraceae bacterium]